MTDRIYIYGAGTGYNIDFELRDDDAVLVDSGSTTETNPGSGIYYFSVSPLVTVGHYTAIAYYQSVVIGPAERIFWDGSDVLDPQSYITELVTTLLKYEKNRTRVDQAAKTLTVYDDDGVTPIRIFDLKNFVGSSSVTEVAERAPQ